MYISRSLTKYIVCVCVCERERERDMTLTDGATRGPIEAKNQWE